LQKHALLAEVGPTTFAVLKDLAFPAAVSDKSFQELCELLTSHYKTGNTVMAERLNLHNRKQNAEESLSDYIVAIKKIAANCNFGNT
jgi:hypothetical protein